VRRFHEPKAQRAGRKVGQLKVAALVALRADERPDLVDDLRGLVGREFTQAIVAIGAGLLCRRDDLRDGRAEAIETHLRPAIERQRAWCMPEALAGETVRNVLDDVGAQPLGAHGIAELGHRDGEHVAVDRDALSDLIKIRYSSTSGDS
jgi:hypothetical protein